MITTLPARSSRFTRANGPLSATSVTIPGAPVVSKSTYHYFVLAASLSAVVVIGALVWSTWAGPRPLSPPPTKSPRAKQLTVSSNSRDIPTTSTPGLPASNSPSLPTADSPGQPTPELWRILASPSPDAAGSRNRAVPKR